MARWPYLDIPGDVPREVDERHDGLVVLERVLFLTLTFLAMFHDRSMSGTMDFLLWLPILGLFQLPYMDRVLSQCLKLLQTLGLTQLGCDIRADWLWYMSTDFSFLTTTFLVYAVIVGVLHHIYQVGRLGVRTRGTYVNVCTSTDAR